MVKHYDLKSLTEEQDNNYKTSILKFPQEYKASELLLALYISFSPSIKKIPDTKECIMRLYWTTLRGFVCTSKLAFGLHFTESIALISRSSESVAVARKLDRHPEKIKLWLSKEPLEFKKFSREFGILFPPDDKLLHPDIFRIWNITSEFGRHPNFSSTGFYTSYENEGENTFLTFRYSDKIGDYNIQSNIIFQIECYIKFLRVYMTIMQNSLDPLWVEQFEKFESSFFEYSSTFS